MANGKNEKDAVALSVPSKGGEPTDQAKKDVKKKNAKEKQEELSEEDRQKKEELELLVQRAQDSDQGVAKMAMEAMVKELKESTSSMTSVPKPLKFLRPHYSTLTEHYAKMPASDLKRFFADVLSILSTTMQKEGSRQALKYRLEGTKEGLTSWGHEYIRNIAGEIGEEFKERTEKSADVGDLLSLVEEIVPFNMQHNAEVDAIDLLCEVEKVQTIEKLCEEPSFSRVCLYLQGLANFAATQADKVMYFQVCMNLYLKYKEYPGALRVALKLNDPTLVANVFSACEDRLVQKQMAFMISRRSSTMTSKRMTS